MTEPRTAKAEKSLSPIWERRDGEPNKWYARFQTYLLLGASRSVYAAYNEFRDKRGAASARKRAGLPKSWRSASEKWEWTKRAEAFDEHERAEQLQQWAQRRDELREQEWKYAQDLLDKARQMLVFPLAKTVRAEQGDGKLVTEIYPTQWKIADAARMLETASKLGRLALGEETERVAHQVEVSSDDLARARQRAKEWETEMYNSETRD